LYNLVGAADLEWLRAEAIRRMRAELPSAVKEIYGLTEDSLRLESTMVEQMGRLTSAEFERVLHPVFEVRARPRTLLSPIRFVSLSPSPSDLT
jgi:hypothetical protein